MTEAAGLPFLRALMARAGDDERPLYTPDRLRFALELAPGADASSATAEMRERLAALLGSSRFTLEPLFAEPDPAESLFLTFSPDGIDRTLPEDMLYAIAADLRVALDLLSCEPDIGAEAFTDPEPAPPVTPESAILDRTCWVQTATPEPKTWALDKTNVPKAWKLSPKRGEGVVIAQPDTGITDHVELADTVFDFTRTLNLIEGGTTPTDPLSSRMSNPGHGTGTGSVAASGTGGQMIGSAPRATLVPIRCINDVKIFNGTPVARAVDHATRVGAHVITMSLGGIFSLSLRRAVRRAVASDVIVMAAAGNCVGTVVWPAAYSEVIAIGGTNIADRKWKGSSSGRLVDFSAPAELVWRAERKSRDTPKDKVSGGQGTSFATALCAGIAALWLAHHGRAAVQAEARRRGTVVQELFRAAVRQTARRPPRFPSGLGAGVIDAGALLELPLANIPSMQVETAAGDDPSGGLNDALAAMFGPGRADPDFNWKAHGAEVSALLIADARAGRGPKGAATEARAFRRASAALIEAAAAGRDSRLAHLALRGRPAAPAITIPAAVDPARLARVLSGLGAGARPDLAPESAAAITPETGQAMLDPAGRETLLARLEPRFESAGAGVDLEHIARALADLHAKGTDAALDDGATFQLEALVSLTERPAIAVTLRETPDLRTVQTVDTSNPEFGRFAGLVELALPELEQGPLAAVGRIDGDGIHLGTGFLVGPGLVLTNRHVAEEFASPLPRAESPDAWQLFRDATVDFSPSGFDPAQRFRITDVVHAGPNPILRFPVSFDNLDLALLAVESVNAAGTPLPSPLGVVKDPNWRGQGQNLYVIGYPAPPGFIPRDEAGAMRHDVVERLRQIFGLRYRQKYFSPGMAQAFGHRWVFDHDATTLGGNSGSLVGLLSGTLDAAGLHFAGNWLRANHAHDLAAVRASDARLDSLLS